MNVTVDPAAHRRPHEPPSPSAPVLVPAENPAMEAGAERARRRRPLRRLQHRDLLQRGPAEPHPRRHGGVPRLHRAVPPAELLVPGRRRAGLGLLRGLRQLAGHLRHGRRDHGLPLRPRRHGRQRRVLRADGVGLGRQRLHGELDHHAPGQRARPVRLLVHVPVAPRARRAQPDPDLGGGQPGPADDLRVRDGQLGRRPLRVRLLEPLEAWREPHLRLAQRQLGHRARPGAQRLGERGDAGGGAEPAGQRAVLRRRPREHGLVAVALVQHAGQRRPGGRARAPGRSAAGGPGAGPRPVAGRPRRPLPRGPRRGAAGAGADVHRLGRAPAAHRRRRRPERHPRGARPREPHARSPAARPPALAEGAVRSYGLDADGPLVLDRVVPIMEAGGTDTGDGHVDEPVTVGDHDPVPPADQRAARRSRPSAGAVRVTVDNSGTVTHVQAGTRGVEQLSDRPRSMGAAPAPAGRPPRTDDGAADPEIALGRAFSRRLRDLVARGGRTDRLQHRPGHDGDRLRRRPGPRRRSWPSARWSWSSRAATASATG